MKSKKTLQQQTPARALTKTECKIYKCLDELLSTGSTKVADILFTLNGASKLTS
ncbi:MAG: hypothetical protein JZU65_17110 [Chlorobium sp.]|nr:hypothetical protein [Chlorobium sp.]